MRSPRHSTSPSVPSLANAFCPVYLARLREQEEVITATEADLAGPWRLEPVLGKPGAVAVLREWEDVDAKDRPVAVWWHEEIAKLLTILLPAISREPFFHLEEVETPDGFPVVAVYGEQGPQVAGWLDRYEPAWMEGLHLLTALVRSPWALATLLEAAGPGAEEQVGRIRARRQRE
jgi:hypothetical protein